MANSFVIPGQVAATALALLRDDTPHAATVNRDYEENFGPGKGATVNVRTPATLKARRRALDAGSAIVLDNVTEATQPVALTTMSYSAVPITDEDLTLRVEDFGRQILSPQVTAIAEDVENLVTATFQAIAETNTTASGIPAYDATKPDRQFTWARKKLRDMGVPASGLYAAVGTGVYADLLNASALQDVSQSGSDAALRNGSVGKVRGFSVIENNRMADDEIVFYHGDAVTLAVRAPRVPDGVAFGESMSAEGFAVRWIKDYDSSILQDRSILSTFLGCQTMTMRHLKADGTTEDVVPAIRVLTGTALV
jgi:hypothetical protein